MEPAVNSSARAASLCLNAPMSLPSRMTSDGGPMTKTILIIEDNKLNMKLFNELLVSRGYTTLCAEDGLEGLELARQHRPDLVVMDIQLRDVSGLEVTQQIRTDHRIAHLPILAVSAFAMPGDADRILAGGCDRYLAKPFAPMRFLSDVDDMVGATSRGTAYRAGT
jgi:two-component system, cell cycle response regulator DivK